MKIYLNSIVDSWSVDWIVSDLEWSTDKQDDIYISSIGGSTDEGFRLANIIQAINKAGKKKVDTHLLSNADSIATVVFLAPPKEQRHIVQSSQMFTHEPRFLLMFSEVTIDDADKMSERLEIEKQRIADFYTKNIEGLTKDEAIALMEGEKTLTSDDMLKHKIVEEVLPFLEMAAIKEQLFNINRNRVQMGLFDRKKPANIVNMKDGSQYLVEGEVQKGSPIQKAGEVVDLNGEFEMEDGKILVAENNKISDIKEVPDEVVVDNESALELVNQVTKSVVAALTEEVINPLEEKITALEGKLQAIKVIPGKHVPDKKEGVNNIKVDPTINMDMQDAARKSIAAEMREIQNKKNEERKTVV